MLGVPTGLLLRVDEITVDGDLEDPALRGDQPQTVDLMFEFF